jgi:quercetin 2,3-dioxygenase
MLQLRTKETLDGGDRGWLKARHHFVVSADGNPANRPLGALLVWNDDEIAPGTGFGRHPHADMEIITYVRQGVVTHEDSSGNIGRTVAGDVQVMSAGTGITHSERNGGEVPLKLFQIWLLPRQRGGTPGWDNRQFPKADRSGRLITLASGDPQDAEALQIRADARVLGATLVAGTMVTHSLGRFGIPISPLPRAWSSSTGNALQSATASLSLTSLNSTSRPRRMRSSSSSTPPDFILTKE